MGISIKHDEYERLIRQLAEDRGTSLTEAIGVAVRNEIDRGRKATRGTKPSRSACGGCRRWSAKRRCSIHERPTKLSVMTNMPPH